MNELFELPLQSSETRATKSTNAYQPLADRLRPQTLSDVVGQEHLTGKMGILTKALEVKHIPSMILWGPPGCGKTTLARIIARDMGAYFEALSAVTHGVPELKKSLLQAKDRHQKGFNTIVLIDEIHRFNRAQQDVLLPYMENGTMTLIGATTENPSFELNAALLSRSNVLVVKPLGHDGLICLIDRAIEHADSSIRFTDAAKEVLCHLADGDGRYLLGMIEQCVSQMVGKELVDDTDVREHLHERAPIYDKNHDAHYNLMSALHKSLRGSDVQASLYWLARMLEGGENPMYLLRRLIRFSVEDIGLADPNALIQANQAKDAFHMLGSPEGELAIAQAVVYLATAPKSNAVYTAYKASRKSAKQTGSLMPPKHILNAPTSLMKEQGYSDGYQYDHDSNDGFSGQRFFPDLMDDIAYYAPKAVGFEREIIKRLDYWKQLKAKR